MRPRPLVKTLTFAVLHFATAFIVVYALTGSAVIGGAVALIEPLCNTVVFYLHERACSDSAGRRRPTPTATATMCFSSTWAGGRPPGAERRVRRAEPGHSVRTLRFVSAGSVLRVAHISMRSS